MVNVRLEAISSQASSHAKRSRSTRRMVNETDKDESDMIRVYRLNSTERLEFQGSVEDQTLRTWESRYMRTERDIK